MVTTSVVDGVGIGLSGGRLVCNFIYTRGIGVGGTLMMHRKPGLLRTLVIKASARVPHVVKLLYSINRIYMRQPWQRTTVHLD